MKTPFYTEMRTRQQLGYIVFSGASLQRDGQGMLFLIQSGDYPADELASRASAFLTEALPAMADMPDEEFETMRASIVSTLEEQDKDMAERIERLELEAVRRGGDFGNREGVIRELKALTRDDVVAAFDTAFSGDAAASLSIYVDANGAETSKPTGAMVIEDVDAFRSAAPVF